MNVSPLHSGSNKSPASIVSVLFSLFSIFFRLSCASKDYVTKFILHTRNSFSFFLSFFLIAVKLLARFVLWYVKTIISLKRIEGSGMRWAKKVWLHRIYEGAMQDGMTKAFVLEDQEEGSMTQNWFCSVTPCDHVLVREYILMMTIKDDTQLPRALSCKADSEKQSWHMSRAAPRSSDPCSNESPRWLTRVVTFSVSPNLGERVMFLPRI